MISYEEALQRILFNLQALSSEDELPAFIPLRPASRLQMIAQSERIISLPEGVEWLPAGMVLQVQLV